MKNVKTITFCLVLFYCLCTNTIFAQNVPTWNIEYKEDIFSKDALLDLRYLNETTAGENGFIKLADDGKSFLTGNGKPIRFWAVGGGDSGKRMNPAQLANYARFLAKIGVNMIRYHGAIFSKKQGSEVAEVDMEEIDAIWKVVAAMKKEGIYTVISPYWAGFTTNVPENWGLGQYKGNTQPWALMYFNEKFKTAYKKWVEVLYTQPNPYTNIPLKDEPAVAIIQIKNEDSLLFWTIQGVKSDLKELIEKKFYDWAIAKYGNEQAITTAWGGATTPADNLAGKTLGIYLIYDATIPQSGGKAKRVSDMVQFLSEHQRNFYAEIVAHYKKIGCKQLTNAMNWKTASNVYLNDAERWTNEVTDVMAVNRYYDPQHTGENNGWRIDPGHKYVGSSILLKPEQFPINIKQSFNKPFMVTESAWNLPHKYQSEGPFLISSYMSLTGIDGYFWFAPSSSGIDPFPYFDFTNIDGQKAMYRWTVSTPGQVSMFPANALLYRKGYISEGSTIVLEERKLTSIWERKIPIIAEENSFDPNRDSWDNMGSATETEIAPIAYLAGAVKVKYDAQTDSKTIAPNLNQLVNLKDKTVISNTNQLKWDYKKGICTMNAPSAQGVTGFLKAASPVTQLSDVKIISDNEYATVQVVAMDEKPIKDSERILIQVGTIYRPTRWSETPDKVRIGNTDIDGFRITNTGVMPWQAQNTRVTVTINNTNVKSAHLLDIYGVISKEIFLEKTSNQVSVQLPENTMYMILNTTAPTITVNSIEDGGAGNARINFYPNPTNNELFVNLPSQVSSQNALHISSIDGKLVATYHNLAVGTHHISTQVLAEGIYYIEFLEQGRPPLRKKLIIKK
jgi:hypothetical protein